MLSRHRLTLDWQGDDLRDGPSFALECLDPATCLPTEGTGQCWAQHMADAVGGEVFEMTGKLTVDVDLAWPDGDDDPILVTIAGGAS